MDIPSTELLSLILNKKITDVSIKTKSIFGMKSFQVISYKPLYENSSFREINLYELTHKCKEWAFKQGYELISWFIKSHNNGASICQLHIRMSKKFEIISDSEPEGIFKACQYILDTQKNTF